MSVEEMRDAVAEGRIELDLAAPSHVKRYAGLVSLQLRAQEAHDREVAALRNLIQEQAETLQAAHADALDRAEAARLHHARKLVDDFAKVVDPALKNFCAGKDQRAAAVVITSAWRTFAERCRAEQASDPHSDLLIARIFVAKGALDVMGDHKYIESDARMAGAYACEQIVTAENALGAAESQNLVLDLESKVEAFIAKSKYPNAARARVFAESAIMRDVGKGLEAAGRAQAAALQAAAAIEDERVRVEDPLEHARRMVRGGSVNR